MKRVNMKHTAFVFNLKQFFPDMPACLSGKMYTMCTKNTTMPPTSTKKKATTALVHCACSHNDMCK